MGIINWGQILENLGVFGLIVGAMAWLLKSLGQDAIARRFKAYEKELDIKSHEYQSKLDTNLESHKAQLNIEHTQYLKLHEKRLEVMTDIYRKIAEVDRTMLLLTARMKPLAPGQSAEQQDFEHMKDADNSYQSFRIYYEDHKIYFNEKDCELLDKLKEKYWDSLWDGTTRQRMGASDIKYNFETAKSASQTVREHIPPIKASLEKEFRMTLGVK